jgi:uncharacterized membrane protein YjjB (DUF3815 family)
MSAASSAGAAGAVIGLVVVLLLQQLGYLIFTTLFVPILDLAIGAVVGAILFGIVGWGLGRRYRGTQPAPGSMPEWKPS